MAWTKVRVLPTTQVRTRGTALSGDRFSDEVKVLVWRKGTPIPGVNPNYARFDRYGAAIMFSQYGQTTSGGMGWEIDHIHPVARYGTDDLYNLQPLQWENNRSKSDDVDPQAPIGAPSDLIAALQADFPI